MRHLIVMCVAAVGMSCSGPTQVDQSAFVLATSWEGELLTLDGQVSLGTMQLQLVGRKDGTIQNYTGQGTLFGARLVFRFQRVDADYDPTDRTVSMAIFDFPTALNRFTGTFDGTRMILADSSLCTCRVNLTQASP